MKRVPVSALLFPLLFIVQCSPQSPVDNSWLEGFPVIHDCEEVIGSGITYYVDASDGNDTNDGLTPSSAWQSTDRVNQAAISAGDRVLFQCGEIWRGRIIPKSGTPSAWVYYGSYDSGEKPLFLGSADGDESSSWTNISGNLWEFTSPFSDDIGTIWSGESNIGVKQWSLSDLNSSGDFYFNKTSGILTFFCTNQPTTLFSEIEIATGQHMFYTSNSTFPHIGAANVSNIVIDGLAFAYGGAYCLKFQTVSHIHIRNCEISHFGGAEVDGQTQVRYGNGIEFYGTAYHCEALSNTIYDIFDSGVSVQAQHSPGIACFVSFEENVIFDCGYSSFELWYHWDAIGQGHLSNITFVGNTCSNAGGGWTSGGTQRDSDFASHLLLDTTRAKTFGIIITNNRFDSARTSLFLLSEGFSGAGNLAIDRNEYRSPTNASLFKLFAAGGTELTNFDLSSSNAYLFYTDYDQNSEFFTF